MKDHPFAAFFSHDLQQALRAVPAFSSSVDEPHRSHGAVTSDETLYRVPGEERLRAKRGGIFSEVIFGPALDDQCACGATSGAGARGTTCPRCGVLCGSSSLREERWGHVEVANVVHPSVYLRLASEPGVYDALGVFIEDVRDVVRGAKALRRVKAPTPVVRFQAVPASDLSEDDLVGPAGLAEALRIAAPEHPLLPLCTITKVPIPPAGERPLAPLGEPTQVDPWIGALNEAWVTLVSRAIRERRLIELSAPPVILQNEAFLTQKAFEAVVLATQRAAERLVPPLIRPPDELGAEEALALAFVGPERLIVQRRDRVSIFSVSYGGEGASLAEVAVLPPAGTRLRGVAKGRFAIFEGYFAATCPIFASSDPGYGPDFFFEEEGSVVVARTVGEVSVIDCASGVYLDRPPAGVRTRFVTNDQPEDLFLTDADGEPIRPLRVGGDRPRAIAYAPGMGLAWVGEEGDSTEIIDLNRGIPHAYPAEPRDKHIPVWDLLGTAARRADKAEQGEDEREAEEDEREAEEDEREAEEDEREAEEDEREAEEDEREDDEEEDEISANAVAFADGAWHLLWSNGVLCDHRARHAVRLRPVPEAAAFDPSGRVLALVVRGNLLFVDVALREVKGRLPLG